MKKGTPDRLVKMFLDERCFPVRIDFMGKMFEREQGEGVDNFFARVWQAWPPEYEWIHLTAERCPQGAK